jgi:hypothetical protein
MMLKWKRNEDYTNPDRSFGSGGGCLSLALATKDIEKSGLRETKEQQSNSDQD